MPFEKGNKFGAKKRIFEAAVRHALERDRDALRRIAEKLVEMAADGDLRAIGELADRLDGKAHQTFSGEIEHTVVTGDEASLKDKLTHRAAAQHSVQ